MRKVMFYFNNIVGTIYEGAHYIIHQTEYKIKRGAILDSSIENNNKVYKTKRK